ncbi:hypothetical protein A9Q84_06520 [Halobacteriovorax marinus]|uniref:Uncharacterized protein n=1 Tax=Halobacteriovorax marinus TaxID=97084 RepID=A0A1Y5F9Y8_9BACT|nr:hypothetical protein A9Q84_06520 [Halobacteriovorax marinus]
MQAFTSIAGCDQADFGPQMEACSKNPSKSWNGNLCRCMTSQTSKSDRLSFKNCSAMKDEAKKKQCMEGLAKSEGLEDTTFDPGLNPILLKTFEIANIINGAIVGGAMSKCWSVKIAKYTGIASTVGSLYAYFKIDDKALKLREEFEKNILSDDEYAAQNEVFEFLRKEQKAIASIAKYKSNLHMVVTLGYTASTAAALTEGISGGSMAAAGCQTSLGRVSPVASKEDLQKQKEAEELEKKELTEKSDGKKKELAEAQGDKAASEKSLKDKAAFEEQKKGLETKETELNKEIAETTKKNDALSTEHDTKTNQEVVASKKIKELSGEKQKLETAQKDITAKKSASNDSFDQEVAKKGKTYTEEYIKENQTVTQNKATSEQMTSQRDSFKQANPTNDSVMVNDIESRFNNEIDSIDNKVVAGEQALQAKATEFQNDMTEIAGQKEIANTAFDQQSTEITTQVNALDEKIVNVKTEVSDLKAGIAKIDAQVEALPDMAKLTKNVEGVKTNIGDLNTKIKAIGSVDTINTNIKGFETKITDLNTDISGLKTDIGVMDTKLISTKADLAQYVDVQGASYLDKSYFTDGLTKVAETETRWADMQYHQDNSEKINDRGKDSFNYSEELNSAYKLENAALSPSISNSQRKSLLIEAKNKWNKILENTADESLKKKFENRRDFLEGHINSIESTDSAYNFKHFIKNAANLYFNFIFPSTHAVESGGDKLKTLGLGMIKSSLLSYGITMLINWIDTQGYPIKEKLGKFLSNSYSVAFFSGVNAFINKKLWAAAKKQKVASENNVKKLEEIQSKFTSDQAKYCPKGRDDINDLTCYCYNDEGGQNSSRTNSKKCQDLWAKGNVNLFAESSDKTRANPSRNRKGCVAANNRFDLSCKCRKFKDQNGQNACKKAGFSSSNFQAGVAQGLSIGDLEKSLNGINSGLLASGELDLSKVNSAINKAERVRDLLYNKLPNKNSIPNPGKINGKVMNAYLNTIGANKKLIGGMMKNGLLKGQGIQLTGKSNMALKNPNRLRKNPSSLLMSGGTGMGGIKSKKKSSGGSMFGGGGTVVRGFDGSPTDLNYKSDKRYNYKNADIVGGKDKNIFEIITRRYQKSGYERLFGDE